MPAAPTSARVRSGDIALDVREHSPSGPGRPTVVLVHGYPDRQETWDRLLEHLPLDRWHVVTYDVRGAGGSGVPRTQAGYAASLLVDDLVAVIDAVAPGDPVHLVGHDWGSVQLWEALAVEGDDERLRGRIASFTSISGPSLDHVGLLSRRSRGRRLRLLWQLAHSYYVYFFHLPMAPELLWRHGHRRMAALLSTRERLPRDHFGDGLAEDAANGVNLYRANVLRRLRRPRMFHTDVPVLVVHPRRDAYLTSVLADDLDDRCSDVRVEQVDARHWVAVTHPDEVAALVRGHVDGH